MIGENEDSIEYIISKLDINDKDGYYDMIKDHLLSYIVEYRNIDNNQSHMINDKIALYEKYIKLCKKKTFDEPFTEINELSKVMTEIGFPDEDKWRILEYIAIKNNETIKEKDIDLSTFVNNSVANIMEYIDNPEKFTIIKKALEPMTIDIDLIPTISDSLHKAIDLDIRITTNIVATIVASSMLKDFEKIDIPEEEDKMREMLLEVLGFIEPIHDEVVYQAREIKNKTEEFYMNSKINGIDEEQMKKFVDVPLTLLEEETESREAAIDLKELPLIESLIQTLDTLDEAEMNSEEYNKCCSVLNKIIEQYLLLEDKKEENLKL